MKAWRREIPALLILASLLTGCGAIISAATSGLADNLSEAILESDDLETVAQALPAYLLLIDALARSSESSVSLSRSASLLYSSYGSGFVEDEERAKRLADRSLHYAFKALCNTDREACNLREAPLEQMRSWVAAEDSVELLYTLGSSWAGWIQAHSDDWNAIAELPRAEMLVERVLALDETHDHGGAHLYMGGFRAFLPASMGGRPEEGKEHFERAIEISQGRNLIVKVVYADLYARLVYNRELHDRLLREVLEADPREPELTLVNLIAQKRAQGLLDSADDYF